MKPRAERMINKFFNKYKTTYFPTNKQIKSMQCSALIDADSLTALVGDTITLTARVEPTGVYDINFKIGGSLINLTPISTDPSGMATLPFDTTGQSPGLYDLTVDVLSPSTCTSSLLTIALTNETVSSNRFGSCVASPPIGECTIDIDTIGAPPGTYSVVAKVGNGSSEQCISAPVETILQEAPGKIIVVSIPPGARIWYDGTDTGINSSAIISNVTPGIDHEITLKLSGYTDYTSSLINIGPGETAGEFVVLEPSTPPSNTGDLHVTSVPDGVEFGLYTGENGIAPTTLTGVPALVDAYEAGLTGYSISMGSVIIKPDVITNLNIVLQPEISGAGLAIFESIPMGADIYIDGLLTGAKTSYAAFIVSGSHTYELRLPGYTTVSGDFTVIIGTDNPAIVSAQLQSEGSGAIMLVGVAVLGMMILSKPK